MSGFDELDFGEPLGTRSVPPKWVAEYAPAEHEKYKSGRPTQKTNKHKVRRKELRERAIDLYSSNEDLSDLNLPVHLRFYGVQLRTSSEYGGPSLLAAESDEGQVEYKLRLKNTTSARFQQLATQLKYRLSEGSGECFYYIGVEDNGHPKGLSDAELEESLQVLRAMAAEVSAKATVLRTPPGSEGGKCAVVKVSYGGDHQVSHEDLRIAVTGGVDCGKSTLVAVLSHGIGGEPALDNGRGSARMSVFRHKHEIESGRTSSISHTLLAYDAKDRVLNYSKLASLTPREMATAASKVARFADLGGHEKYSKTSLYAMTCTLPDYVMLCVCASTGLSWSTKEHLAVALSLGVPPFVVVTKADTVPSERVAAIISDVRQLVAAAQQSMQNALQLRQHSSDDTFINSAYAEMFNVSLGNDVENDEADNSINYEDVDKLAPLVTTTQQAQHAAATLGQQRAFNFVDQLQTNPSSAIQSTLRMCPPYPLSVPLFIASSVTGEGVALLHAFLAALPPSHPPSPSTSTSATGHDMDISVGCGSDVEVESMESHRKDNKEPAKFQVDASFEVPGVGRVLGGTMLSGKVCIGDELMLGPEDSSPAFTKVVVTNIQRAQVDTQCVGQGQHATLAVTPVNTNTYSNGNNDDDFEVDVHYSPSEEIFTIGTGNGGQLAEAFDKLKLETDTLAAVDGGGGGGVSTDFIKTDKDKENVFIGEKPAPFSSSTAAVGVPVPKNNNNSSSSSRSSSSALDLDFLGKSWKFTDRLHPFERSPSHIDTSALPLQGPDYEPSSSLSSSSSHRPRKGTVLLSPSLQPRAVWEFEAVLVLLGGHWPEETNNTVNAWDVAFPEPYSPTHQEEEEEEEDPEGRTLLSPCARFTPPVNVVVNGLSSSSSGSDVGEESLRNIPDVAERLEASKSVDVPEVESQEVGSLNKLIRTKSKGRIGAYSPIVHCGGIRQAAKVLHIHPVTLQPSLSPASSSSSSSSSGGNNESCSGLYSPPKLPSSSAVFIESSSIQDYVAILGAVAAAGVMQAVGGAPTSTTSTSSSMPVSISRVRFSFAHRPEWMEPGMRLVVRDRSGAGGKVAGAGYICSLGE